MKKPYKWVEQAVVISAMRRAFRRFPAYKQCLDNAKTVYYIQSKHGKDLRRVQFECAQCHDKFPRTHIAIDHLSPVVDPTVGFVDYNVYASRLFCDLSNLQVLCNKSKTSCHKVKSKLESSIRAKSRKDLKK